MVAIRCELLATTSQTTQQQSDFHNELVRDLAQHQDHLTHSVGDIHQHIDKRMHRLEQLIADQETRLYKSQASQLGSEFSKLAVQRANAARSARTKPSISTGTPRCDAIGIRMNRYIGNCQHGCPCTCHKQQKSITPSIIERFLGQLSIGYCGVPILSAKCDNTTCTKSQTLQVSAEYWFPMGLFWSQIVRLQVGYEPNIGPQLQLSVLHRVPDSAACIDFALKGNIDGLKDLFRRGLASPRDVSSTRGYTILRWAMYAKQYQTCRFLMHQGADPDYRPISPYDNSPRNKANDFILQGGLSTEAEEIYRQIGTDYEDYIDGQRFTMLHKVVLGLSFQSLEDMILQYPEDIDTPDAMDRTPLSWAACRGAERATVLLLANGADPNTVDVQLAGPVSNASDRGHTACVRLLLEAGGDPDPIRPGLKKGSPLNCAARNASDPLLIKTLLDFGADIEACGVDGITPLLHVARTDNVSFAQILLEYGAYINAMSSAQHTPLTIAITHNSHRVLQLLLDRWYEYSECPRLKGPHVLPLVVTFADAETISILSATDHFRLKYDQKYTAGDYMNTLRLRFDADEELILAFSELLNVMNDHTHHQTTLESAIESGSLQRRCTGLLQNAGIDAVMETEKDFESSSDWDEFENALESLAEVQNADRSSCPVLA